MTLFEQVKDQSTSDYFGGNHFSIDVFNKKYAAFPNETYIQGLKRVCDFVSSVEDSPEKRKFWSERWFDEIYNDWWHPAGSIMQGAGSKKSISLCNCTTISLGNVSPEDEEWDSLEAIVKNMAFTVAKSAASRQGLGVDFSRLRPRGTQVFNSSNESTGAIHWMKFIDSIGYYVGQKGRIPAMLFSLSVSHPDIEEFVTVKSDFTKIQNANISVQISDVFYRKVANDGDWELRFDIPAVKKGQKVYIDVHSISMDSLKDEKGYYYISRKDRPAEKIRRKIKARSLLELIAKNMCVNAEPGIQNIDIARRYSNSDYVYDPGHLHDSRIQSTNACSEQYLSRESLCVLSSINCGRFSVNQDEYEGELYKIGESINRFLDNVNECELLNGTYATPHQKVAISALRRTGAGYTNLAAWLFKQNLCYGSIDASEKVEKFTERYNYHLYRSSIALGREKGSFGLFNQNKLEKSPFIKRMSKLGLVFDALRNVTVSSIAPTGTLSTQFRGTVMSYGIEPAFGMYYWKRTRMAGKYEYYFCVPSVVKEVFEKSGYKIPMKSDALRDEWDGRVGKPIIDFIEAHREKMGIQFKDATHISAKDKLELMSRVMKWVDSSISVTYMLPQKSTWQDVYDFILKAHEKEVKSIAVFPDRKMYGIVSFVPFKDLAMNLRTEGVDIHPQNFSDDELKELNLARQEINHVTTNVPKRLPSLDADISIVTVKNERFIIVVGFQNGVPYEIFGGHANGMNVKGTQRGKITKISKGQYSLEFNNITIDDFVKQFTPTEVMLFRLCSTMLRHGVPVPFIVEQLQKSTKDLISLSAAATRVLKKYIKNGQKAGGECPQCGQGLVYMEGCVSCSSCQWSKCS